MYELRPYQQDAVTNVIQHFKRERSPCIVVLPTGAGKSLVIAKLASVARGRVLVLQHVKELVEQNFQKFQSFNLDAGIFSAGLNEKMTSSKVIFGSIQSVVNAEKIDEDFFKDITLLVIDECHRVGLDEETQYQKVINRLKEVNPEICILGLTATPYRLGLGWIYEYHVPKKELKTRENRFFKKCVYELSIKYLINNHYLTPPVLIDAPVASYDFSKLESHRGDFRESDIEKILLDQKRITPTIIKNIVEMSHDRNGVMIFTSSVRHANEILKLLPMGSALVTGETPHNERDDIINAFKERKIKFLVNVSVLTTGFDAPHVDVIALLRPTESVSLFQQIVGRGLRLSPGKTNCLILDYTGLNHDLYRPVIDEDRPHKDAQVVDVECPKCHFINQFFGIIKDGELFEHYGRSCKGAELDQETNKILSCDFLFRFKLCHQCSREVDISAKNCKYCSAELVDIDKKLKEIMQLKDAHIMKPDHMSLEKISGKFGEKIKVSFFDFDGNELSESFFYANKNDHIIFELNFLRFHKRIPEESFNFESIDSMIKNENKFRLPRFIVARLQKKRWVIREKIF